MKQFVDGNLRISPGLLKANPPNADRLRAGWHGTPPWTKLGAGRDHFVTIPATKPKAEHLNVGFELD